LTADQARADTGGGTTARLRFPSGPLVLVAFVVGAAIALYVQVTFIRLDVPIFGLFKNQVDLDVYRAGAQHLLHGQQLYDLPMLRNGLLYTYTPFSTIVFQPFGWMSEELAADVWSALIFATLYWVILASFKSLGYEMSWTLAIVSASMVCMSTLMEPVRTTIWYGQINVFLMAIVLWDLLRPDGSRLKSIGVGIAAGIKLTPAFFVVYLALTRRWRAVVVVIATFIATMLLGFLATPRQSWSYWTDRVVNSDRVGPTDAPSNQSIKGALATVFHTATPSTALWVLCSAVAVVLGMAAAYLAHRAGQELLALCLTGMTTAAVSPFTWGHHWVWFVPLLVFAVHLPIAAWRDGRKGLAGVVALAPPALFVAVFVWRNHLPGGALGFKPFYGTGMFMTPFPDWLRWFSAEPYLWVFGVTAVLCIAVWGPRELRTRTSTVGHDQGAHALRQPDNTGLRHQ
jgi:alpha-1,2-mannosyltransferase